MFVAGRALCVGGAADADDRGGVLSQDAVHTVGVEVTVGQEAFALQVEFPQMKDLHSSGASALQTNGASSGGAQQARSRLQMQRRWALLRQDVSFVFGKKRGQDLAMASFRQMVAGEPPLPPHTSSSFFP